MTTLICTCDSCVVFSGNTLQVRRYLEFSNLTSKRWTLARSIAHPLRAYSQRSNIFTLRIIRTNKAAASVRDPRRVGLLCRRLLRHRVLVVTTQPFRRDRKHPNLTKSTLTISARARNHLFSVSQLWRRLSGFH